LPVWLLHWRWTERWARESELERASTLRRLYLYAVLVSAIVALAYAAHAAIAEAVVPLNTLNTAARRSLEDALNELPVIVIAALVWTMHWRIAARDRRLVGEQGGSATLRRWYLYATAFVGFVLLLTGASGVLEAAWRSLTAGSGPSDLSDAVASTLVGMALW